MTRRSSALLGVAVLSTAALVAGTIHARNVSRSCLDGKRLIAARINDHFKALVATGAFHGIVPHGWQFNQIRAHDEQIDLNLTNGTGASRTIAMLLNGAPEPGELHDLHFRLRVPPGTDPADSQVLLSLAAVIDNAVTDLDIPCQRTWLADRRERTNRWVSRQVEAVNDWNSRNWTRQVGWDWQKWSRMEAWFSAGADGVERRSSDTMNTSVRWVAGKCAQPLNWILGRSTRGPLWLAICLGVLKFLVLGVALVVVLLAPRPKEKVRPPGMQVRQ
jgi:hypothetical protein